MNKESKNRTPSWARSSKLLISHASMDRLQIEFIFFLCEAYWWKKRVLSLPLSNHNALLLILHLASSMSRKSLFILSQPRTASLQVIVGKIMWSFSIHSCKYASNNFNYLSLSDLNFADRERMRDLTSLIFERNWRGANSLTLELKGTQTDLSRSKISWFSIQIGLSLKGVGRVKQRTSRSRKIGWWSESPPFPTHCLNLLAEPISFYVKRNLSRHLDILSSPTHLLLQVGVSFTRPISSNPALSRICRKKLVRVSEEALDPKPLRDPEKILSPHRGSRNCALRVSLRAARPKTKLNWNKPHTR